MSLKDVIRQNSGLIGLIIVYEKKKNKEFKLKSAITEGEIY